MPKRKEPNTEEDVTVDVLGLGHKKHKKHKHKKHKKKRGLEDDDSGGASPGTPSDGFKTGLKLKIKIGGQTFGEARVSKAEINEASSDDCGTIEVDDVPSGIPIEPGGAGEPSGKKPKKLDEEEAWLAALEAGRLEEVDDELRRMKDPNLMTARQRSLLESKTQKEREESMPVVVEEKVLTEEMIQKRMIRAKKRKEQAEEKKEKDKKQTIERLLKKTDAKVKGLKKMTKKSESPKVKYIDNRIKGPSLSFPLGYDFPLKSQVAKKPPPVVHCGVVGCDNKKKYSCSKTGIPLCSLECYKKNLLIHAGSTIIPVS